MNKKIFLDRNNNLINEVDIGKYQDFYATYEWEDIKCKEIYSNRKIVSVEYYVVEIDFSKIKNYHLSNYSGALFYIFFNNYIYYFDNQGNFLYLKIFVEKGNIYCEAEYNINGFLNLGQVLYLSETEEKELLYAFEYGKDKRIFNCFSFKDGENENINSIDAIILKEALNILEKVKIKVLMDYKISI